MISEILFFLLGCLVGWFTNHWYSVGMRQPKLIQNGGGSGSSLFGSGYRYVSIGIQNELRRLGVSLPETVILGKAIRTNFGGQVIEREPARQCRARLLERTGEYIYELWWYDGEKASEIIDIKSGETANLIVFAKRANDPNQYLVYQPISGVDFSPRTSGIPKFDKTMSFLVEILYSHGGQRLKIPVSVKIGYDGSFNFHTENSEVGF
jgi:hypothetical protein